jgi:hypothetical protein
MLLAWIGYLAGCRLVNMLVGSQDRVGLVTPTPNGHLPALFGGPFRGKLPLVDDPVAGAAARAKSQTHPTTCQLCFNRVFGRFSIPMRGNKKITTSGDIKRGSLICMTYAN